MWPCRPPQTVVSMAVEVAAIDPELVGQVGRAELGIALGVVAVTGDAVGGEDRLAGLDRLRIDVLRAGVRQRIDIGDDVRAPRRACSIWSRPNAGICDTRLSWCAELMPTRMVLKIVFRLAAPQPDDVGQVGKARAALGVEAVAGRAIVAEQRVAGLAHDRPSAADRPGCRGIALGSRSRLVQALRSRRRLASATPRRSCAGRCRAGPWCRSRRAARPASGPSSRARTGRRCAGRNTPRAAPACSAP